MGQTIDVHHTIYTRVRFSQGTKRRKEWTHSLCMLSIFQDAAQSSSKADIVKFRNVASTELLRGIVTSPVSHYVDKAPLQGVVVLDQDRRTRHKPEHVVGEDGIEIPQRGSRHERVASQPQVVPHAWKCQTRRDMTQLGVVDINIAYVVQVFIKQNIECS